jgi:hypothetical protein
MQPSVAARHPEIAVNPQSDSAEESVDEDEGVKIQ